MTDPNRPSSDRIVSCLLAYRLSAALKAALELDLFTAIAEGHLTADALATRCNANPRGIRILADFLVMRSFLSKTGSAYGLTDDVRLYLNAKSPDYIGQSHSFGLAPALWDQFGRLTEIVRQGGARSHSVALEPNSPLWIQYARTMANEMADTARLALPHLQRKLNRPAGTPLKILNVAAGHGMFGITLAQAHPACRVVAQDWPHILAITREHAAAHGVADRIDYLPGDIQQLHIGTGFDLVLIPNLIHYLSPAATIQLLTKVRAAMNPNAVIAIVEYAPNDDRLWPPFATFALFSLATSADGDAYTVNEILKMCWDVGFRDLEYRDVGWERLMMGTTTPAAPIPQVPAPLTPKP